MSIEQPTQPAREWRPALGRIVHFVLNIGPNAGAHRPAIVVGMGEGNRLDLQVFSNGTKSSGDYAPNVFHKKSAAQDPAGKEPGTWHTPEGQG